MASSSALASRAGVWRNASGHQQRTPKPAQQMRDHIKRRWIGPVNVIQRKQHGPASGEPLQHSADGVMESVSIGCDPAPRHVDGQFRQRREHGGELLHGVSLKRTQTRRLERPRGNR